MNKKQMKGAMFLEPGKIEVQNVNIPKIKENEVLVKIKYCGICGTDMHIYNGVYSKDKLPLIAGHEFSGTIESVGSNVKRFKGGEKVVADINFSCGTCFYCRQNQPLMCEQMEQLGIHINGAFAEYVVIPEHMIYEIPGDMDLKDAALLEPISCVVRSAKQYNIKFAESVVIIGDGAIALIHVQMAKICGAAPIIVIGLDDNRMEKAKELGADYVIKSGEGMYDEVKRLTEGRGGDVVIESVGIPVTYDQTFKLVRPGGRIVAFGLANEDCAVKYKPFEVIIKELSMVGTVAGAKNDLAESITLVKHNRFNLEDYKTTVVKLNDIAQAFERLKTDRSILKILVDIE
ncbi:MAG: alcohol dehydrogenase catalytic domain-containing protein [Tepidibacter sp.]|jgi:2-desacetyl-2-hydroxyethyl bacteriochlorophyllide A dehydrogenase|uniref:zinc-dependent alcohol dehydrogenase n=1 Tax=Tepidibacter sp. TaxID=2529387 RepID=UPI0025D0C667|nr:alcohol dehydrogenase catalytic domain-containing protein [Tepidibacter sp.]MCT4507700.1 alcohol dehydrogenase catalytic domain-containing protein [Tepidibacter sp.]